MAYSTIVISPSNIADLISLGLFNNINSNSNSNSNKVYAAETTSNNTSLIIDNGTATSSTTTVRNNVAYSSHTVQVKADNITAYSLTINGPVGLTGGTGSSTTITGANNKTPANMANNTWGYAFAPNTANNESTLSYQSFTGNNQTLNSNNPSISNNSIDFTRKLVFAAKFSQDAVEGHYRANVKLNLTVTPRTVVNWSVNYNMNGGSGGPSSTNGTADGISHTYTIPTTAPTTSQSGYKFDGYSDNNSSTIKYRPGDTITLSSTNPSITLYAIYKLSAFPSSLSTMQGMTPEICASVATGVSKTLTDSGRGNTQYNVRKLRDGNCWMVDNLKLNIRNYTLSSSNTDLASGVSFSSSSATLSNDKSTWSNSDDTAIVYSSSPTVVASGGSYNANYGYYYSWCAATAGTCKDTGGNVIVAGNDASSSICPKGWKLPAGKSTGDFQALYDKYNPASGWSIENSLNGKWLGAVSVDAGGAFFSAAGSVSSDGLSSGGTSGSYWSRTAYNSYYAYYLSFHSGNINPASYGFKYAGFPVRCVAYSS